MNEQAIEKRLKKEIELIGGKALKFVSPGLQGVPDRIVLLPKGKMVFVELKAPGEKPRPIQSLRIKELRKLGFDVRVLDSIDGVLEFVREVQNGI